MNYKGSIVTIIGPMCGGKTTRLIAEKRRNQLAGKRVLMLKHPGDNRYTTKSEVVTHDMVSESGINSKDSEYLYNCGMTISEITNSYDVVCIDEGQFYKDVDKFCDDLANYGLRVIVSALLGNYKREPFSNIARLLAYSEKIIHARAIDRNTGEEAAFTFKKAPKTDEDIEIGGLDKYEALGRYSYFTHQ